MSLEPFIGEIKLFGFDYAPRGYKVCKGQMMPIAVYAALFALLGTKYGGDGKTTFNLPDMQGRVAVGQGQGAGLTPRTVGEYSGIESNQLTISNLPAHAHSVGGITVKVPVSSAGPDASSPANAFLANDETDKFSSVSTPNQFYGSLKVEGNTSITGSGSPFDIMNPSLVINYSIAIEGVFPSRD